MPRKLDLDDLIEPSVVHRTTHSRQNAERRPHLIERRATQRFSITLPTRISWCNDGSDENRIELTTANICAGGAFFRTDTPLPVDTRVDLNVLLPFQTHQQGYRSAVKVSGTVVSADQNSISIAFDSRYKFHPMATDDL